MTNQHSSGDEHWAELAAAHALNALDPDDEQLFLEHLSGCSTCAATFDEYALVAAQLGSLADAAPDDAPSWSKLRSTIVADEPSPVTLLHDRRRRPHRRTVVRALSAAAAVVAVAAGAGLGWDLTRSSPAPSMALAACQHQRGCSVIPLHTAKGASPADVVVNENRIAVAPLALPALSEGHTYVLWQLPRDGSPIPVVEFRDTGRQTAATPLPADYGDTAAFAISIESTASRPTRPTHVLAVGTPN